MPKQIWKIDQFHGGLNNNSDPRDIAPNEWSDLTDIMVDKIGKIRLFGTPAVHDDIPQNNSTIAQGYGLFQFSHDRLGGSTSGENQVETGDDYLASGATDESRVDIFSRVEGTWGTSIISLGSGTSAKIVYYYADGALRISDASFDGGNETKWYGYVDRTFFGTVKDEWATSTAAPKALSIDSITNHVHHSLYPDDTYPIKIEVFAATFSEQTVSSSGTILDTSDTVNAQVDWSTANRIDSYSSLDPNFTNFCSIGDFIAVFGSNASPGNYYVNDRIFKVTGVASTYIDVLETTDTSNNNDQVTIHNLSKSNLFDPVNHGFEFAVSTLYDDSKQESALYKFEVTGTNTGTSDTIMTSAVAFGVNNQFEGWRIKNLTDGSSGVIRDQANTTTVEVAALTGGSDNSWDSGDKWSISVMTPMDIAAWGHTPAYGFYGIYLNIQTVKGDETSTGLIVNNPRVSGYKIYMRRENTSTWYLQSEADVTKGHRLVGSGANYNSWTTTSLAGSQPLVEARTNLLNTLREVETYESETGYSAENDTIGLDGVGTGFKTAVVSNRITYLGNVSFKDWKGDIQVYGDTILKSGVGKFDSFTFERRLEIDIRDGDEIVKLEEYADRLLVFKKNKMQLLNISQEIEFLEDSFMHKGISHPASACKTDFGIAWVNKLGCYIYDGKSVINLFEKGGRQLIDESLWKNHFSTTGYVADEAVKEVITTLTTVQAADTDPTTVYAQTAIAPIDPTEGLDFFYGDGDTALTVTHTIIDDNSGIFTGDIVGTIDYSNGYMELVVDDNGPDAGDDLKLTYNYAELVASSEDHPLIGYIPKSRQLLVTFLTTSQAPTFIYDIVTQSWVKSRHGLWPLGRSTNLITDWNGNLTANHGPLCSQWNNDSSTNIPKFNTKDIDFGQPGQKKKIYRVLISYKGDAVGVEVRYQVNGEAPYAYGDYTSGRFFKIGADGNTTGADAHFRPLVNAGTDDWLVAELKPEISINNVYSFKLVSTLSNIYTSNFEINDISIVYRLKPVR